MKLTDLLTAEIDREHPLTRRAVEASPEGRDDWKPHDKSMPIGRLTDLVATMPFWWKMMIEQDEFDVVPAGGQPDSGFSRVLKTRAERVKNVDEGFASAKRALQQTTDEHLQKNWTLKAKGHVVQSAPRHVMIQDAINHLAHHRGQLTVYLRLNDIKVPSIYGPTADDQSFG